MTDLMEDKAVFDYAPISLWLEDYSQVKQILDGLRSQGVQDIFSYLTTHQDIVDTCMAKIIVLDVNQETLNLFRAQSKNQLLENISSIFRDEMRTHFTQELADMYYGKFEYQREGINYALNGTPLDILLHWRVLPGYEQTFSRVLVSIADLTSRKIAERALAGSEKHFHGLFEYSPISLWEEDYSEVKKMLDTWEANGITNLRLYLLENPHLVHEAISKIKVLDVNNQTLKLFGAHKKSDLLSNLNKIFRNEMEAHFIDELVEMYEGNLAYDKEGVNYSLTGEPIDIQLHWAVLPGNEASFSRVLVSIEDITARKKAESYLKYLGTHDVLTGLYNRAFFDEERARLERSRQFPISIFIADLDGLKKVNDSLGHEAGDDLLRRTAEVLRAAFRAEDVVARTGGDEFAIILPNTDLMTAEQSINRIQNLIAINNNFYRGPALSLSIGVACGELGASLQSIQREADDRMYVVKQSRHKLRHDGTNAH